MKLLKQGPIKLNKLKQKQAFEKYNQLQSGDATIATKLNDLKKQDKEYQIKMKQYRQFENETEECISGLLTCYQNEWELSQKQWYKWNTKQIAGWFEYILSKNSFKILTRNLIKPKNENSIVVIIKITVNRTTATKIEVIIIRIQLVRIVFVFVEQILIL